MTVEGKRSLQEVLRDAWLVAMGLHPEAAADGRSTIITRLQNLMNLTQEEGTHLISEFTQRVRQNRDDLERRLEDSIRVAVQRLGTPLAAEVAALRGRVEALGAKLETFDPRRRNHQEPTP